MNKERIMLLESVFGCAQFLELIPRDSEFFQRGLEDLERAVEKVEAYDYLSAETKVTPTTPQ